MNWKIEIKPTAEKSYLKLSKKSRQRIKKALAAFNRLPFSLLNGSA